VISGRHAVALLVLFALALLPTVQHGYVGYTATALRVTQDVLPVSVDGIGGAPKQRTGGWMTSTYAADSWAERTYTRPGAGDVSLFVARGFDLKKLYHHPELGVLRGNSFEPLRRATIDGEPVHVLQNLADGDSAVYALIYEQEWVGNPYVLQASSAFTSLWTGRRPLTLVFVYGPVLDRGQPTATAARLLPAAVERLRTAGV
jgi:hypothetical protein